MNMCLKEGHPHKVKGCSRESKVFASLLTSVVVEVSNIIYLIS